MTKNFPITSGPPNGSLILHGGGNITCSIDIFLKLAGGSDSTLIYIPTAFSDEELKGPRKSDLNPTCAAQRFGFKKAHVLHTRDRNLANSNEFIKPIQGATAVWFTGGRQWRLADSYLNTKMHEELDKLLQRGGVIAGSSAGATIQGSYLVRGDTESNIKMIGDHQQGFGFITNIAIDQHHLIRNRQYDMFDVIEMHPELLGIGIDIDTCIVVQDKEFTVIGRTYVSIYDRTFFSEEREMLYELSDGERMFYLLGHGSRYNMEIRRVIK